MNRICVDPLHQGIAVIGAGCRLPGGCDTPGRFWSALAGGRRLRAARPTPGRFAAPQPPRDATAATDGGPEAIYLDGVDLFDAGFFGISPREAMRMDPQHRLFLEVAVEALEDAGLPLDRLAGQRVGVFLGLYGSDYAWLPEAMACPPDVHSASGGGPVFAANRLSHALDLRGPSLAVDTTCSSSLVAAHLACMSLRAGECDVALVGGVNLILSRDVAASAAQSVPLAAGGLCRAFAEDAAGAVLAEGCTVLALKRDGEAARDGDRVMARIIASAVNHDGQASSLTAPNPAAQSAVIRAACAQAGIGAERLAYLEAHGTGTELGDAIEIEALLEVLRPGGPRPRPAGLGALKAQFGHLEANAGATGLLRACLSILHREVTPHPLDRRAHPLLRGNEDVLALVGAPLPLGDDDVVGVSGFSLGGTNAHVLLEAPAHGVRAPGARSTGTPQTAEPGQQTWVVPLSARSPAALRGQIDKLSMALGDGSLDAAGLADIGHTAAARRTPHGFRRAFVVQDKAELRRELALAAERLRSGPEPRRAGARAREVVFVFPGHGAQWSGMARGLLGRCPAFDAAVARLDAAFREHLDWSVAAFLEAEDDERVMAGALHAQPALFTMQIALAELLTARGVRCAATVGYSAGELAAMAITGTITETEAVRLCALRAQHLAAAPAGGMLALRLPEAQTQALLPRLAPGLALAAVNGPETTIVSGPRPLLERFAAEMARRDVLCLDTGVPYAFHHPEMGDAADELSGRFASAPVAWREPRLPLYSSVLGGRLRRQDIDARYWRDGACATLRFDRAVLTALEDEFTVFLEVAPSASLTGDLRDTIRGRRAQASGIASLRRGVDPLRALSITAMELFEAGAIDHPGTFNPAGGGRAELPTYAWDRAPYWWPPASAGESRSRPAPVQALAGAPARDDPTEPVRKVYTLAWHAELAAQAGAPAILDSARLREIDAATRARATAEGLDAYASREVELNAICAGFAHRALVELGGPLEPGGRVRPARLARDLGLDMPRRRMIERLCTLLAEAGVLAPEEDAWRVVAPPADDDPQQALAALIPEVPGVRHELKMLARSGPAIAAVIRGERDALELLFPQADAGHAAAIFSESGIARVMNALAREAVAAVLAGRASEAAPRVLEIGAGTGGTSASLLDLVAAQDGSYCLTDISRTLLRFAEKRFSGQPECQVRRLDITQPPERQGFARASFDLVVCANVLHATPDLAESLKHLRRLLAPGGALVLLEAVGAQPLVDLTFGLTRDWWGFTDTGTRTSHPLLPREDWLALLARSGFADTRTLPGDASLARTLDACVFVAREAGGANGSPPVALSGAWLVLGRRDETREAVAARLREAGASVVCHTDVDEAALAGAHARAPDGVVDLRALALDTGDGDGGGALLDRLRELLPGTFAMTRAFSRRAGSPPTLCLVTAAATTCDARVGFADPLQAALRGVGETMSSEHPDWDIRSLDCLPATPQAVAAAVMRELAGPRNGVLPSAHGGRRLMASLEPHHAAVASAPPVLDPAKTYVVTGGLGSLGLEIAEWLAARGARRLLLVQRGQGSEAAAVRIDALRARGVGVTLRAADLADPDGARHFASELAAGSRAIGGVVHAAGVFEDSLLMNQDWPRFRRAFAAKVLGGWELYRALAGADCGFVIFCSSVAGLLHPAGLSNYVAANAFVGALAQRARGMGMAATAIAWGGWSGLGMASRQSDRWLDRWRRLGVSGLSPDDLRAALDLAARGDAPAELWVMDVDWHRLATGVPTWRRPLFEHLAREPEDTGTAVEPAPSPGDATQVSGIDGLSELSGEALRACVAEEVRRLCIRILELADHFDLEPDLPLADLGLDSLLALELRGWLCTAFGLELQPTLLFDFPTPEALEAHIVEQIEDQAGVSLELQS